MANRIFRSDLYTAEQGIVLLAGTLPIGAGGVPRPDARDFIPFVSASRGGTGLIHLDFSDPYVEMRAWSCSIQNSGSVTADLHVDMSGSNVRSTANHVSASAGKRASFLVKSGSASVDHPGIKLSFLFAMKNSAV